VAVHFGEALVWHLAVSTVPSRMRRDCDGFTSSPLGVVSALHRAGLNWPRVNILRRVSSVRSLTVPNLLGVVDAPLVLGQSRLSKFPQIPAPCPRSRAQLGAMVVLRYDGHLDWPPTFGSGWVLLNVTQRFAKGG
jgi:hypothetical protein